MMSIFSRKSFPALAILLGGSLLLQPLYRLGQLALVLPFSSLKNILDNPPHVKLLIKSFATQGVLLVLLGFILSGLFVLYYTNRDGMARKTILGVLIGLSLGECGLFFSSRMAPYEYRHIDYHLPFDHAGNLSVTLSFPQLGSSLLDYLSKAKAGDIQCFIRPHIFAFPNDSLISIEGVGLVRNDASIRLKYQAIDQLIYEKKLHLSASVQKKDSLVVRDVNGFPLHGRQDIVMLNSVPLHLPKDQSTLVYFMFMTHDSKPLAVFF